MSYNPGSRFMRAVDARDYLMAGMTKQSKKRKLTDDEIDALVIAEADDLAAWGEPVIVPPSKSARPAWMSQSKHKPIRNRRDLSR
ncbi:MAG TPA: hypothetical protein VNN08_12680 [Thermoanaerobaculia bacterium]|nr:hypothetical protein [Thermoanaerobaculia bacterium]